MTAQAAVQRNSTSVGAELRTLVGQRTTIENQQRKFSDRLLAIDAEIEQLKPRHFDGDTKAAPAIEKLEVEKRDLLLRVEGANTYIRQFDEQIMPLRRELNALDEIADAQRVADDAMRRFGAFESRLNDLVSARIATYRAACASCYREAEFLDSEIERQPLNPAERNSRLHAVEIARQRFDAVLVEIANNKWQSGPGNFATWRLKELVVKLPPENENGLH